MDYFTGALLLTTIIVGLFVYFSQSKDDRNSSIPYVIYKNYPIIGHLLPFIFDRRRFFMECQQQYGNCFRIRLFNQPFTMILAPSDWTSILRNPSFIFPSNDLSTDVFDASSDLFGKCQY